MTTPRPQSAAVSFGCGGFLVLIGCLFLWLIVSQLLLPEWRVNTGYVPHTCTVLDKRLGESDGEDGKTYRPEIRIRYEVGGQTFETWTYDATGTYSSGRKAKQHILQNYAVGQQYPCWYDPANPAKAVLVRGWTWWAFVALLIPLAALGFGALVVKHAWQTRGQSPEQLAAAGRSSEWHRASVMGATDTDFPAVPYRDLSEKPGAELRFRLAQEVSPGCMAIGLGMVCLFWNGIVSIFVVNIVSDGFRGIFDWCQAAFLTPFVAIGGYLLYQVVKQALIAVGIPPTQVEIDAHPLQVGQDAEFFVRQEGSLTLRQFSVQLVCEEAATYREGTDTRTETKTVFREVLVEESPCSVRRHQPFSYRGKLRVPAELMHSFVSPNNKVQWKLVVVGDVVNWPDFTWEYPVVVRPAGLLRGG